jgi:chromosome segregation protein
MKLEKIVVNGFKSFADKTEFEFDSSLTAIVGPNGCGKSNVVDAVKWALGDQSVKSLRSDQMADVIFGGCASRKPSGTAEVKLVLSDADGQLPIEADRVEISRRIYTSGESEYRINNKLCRLKDMRELLMDTGLGAKAYSIIEQGQVEQLLSASKSDRRVIFEEAAGISKYKAHKKEALRKLERTEQNLLRLADIFNEVQRSLRSIKLAAGKARNFVQYNRRLNELQAGYSLAEYHKNRTSQDRHQASMDRLNDRLASVTADLSSGQTLLSEIAAGSVQARTRLGESGSAAVAAQGRIEKILQRIDFLRARTDELVERKKAASARIAALRKQQELIERERVRLGAESGSFEQVLKAKTAELEKLQQDIGRIDASCKSVETQLDDEKSGIIDIVRRTAQLHNEIQSISTFRSNLNTQKNRLANQAQTAEQKLEQILTEKAQCRARLADIEKVLSELAETLESKRLQEQETAKSLAENTTLLAGRKETKSAIAGELAVLRDMENRREGLNESVKDFIQRLPEGRFDYVEGLLADIVTADVEYAAAIEAALEGATDAVVVSSTAALLGDREQMGNLAKGVKFICTDRIRPFADSADLSGLPQAIGRAVEFVRYSGRYAPLIWHLLGKTVLVESIEGAVGLCRRLPCGYSFVTLDGQLLAADGSIKLGRPGKAMGLISRKSRLRQLEQAAERAEGEITQLAEQVARQNNTGRHLSKLLADLRTSIYEANTEKIQLQSRHDHLAGEIERLRTEQPLITRQIDQLERQVAESVQKEYDSKQKLEELEAVNSQRGRRIEQLQQEHARHRQTFNELNGRLADLRVAVGQIREQNKAIEQAMDRLRAQVIENRSSAETARADMARYNEESSASSVQILECEAEVSELFVEKERQEQSCSLLHKTIEELEGRKKDAEQKIEQKRSEHAAIERDINEVRVAMAQLQVKNQDLVEKVREQLRIDLVQAYGDYTEQQADWDAVREEMSELRRKIQNLGNVNLDAINEQDQLETRHDFLSKQLEDLNHGRADLQQLINRLNKISREKFSQTFEQIRTNFQQVFRKLFGGGKADVFLEDAEDILDAPIEIIARPPGKETRSISLLSGGEKSMTAIALLFAVFKTKPSPFCFLDEVDAALDEANIERFGLLVREFMEDSQFIVITHSKRTMSIAQTLIGVTMQTRGISKKITVRFGKAAAEPVAA